MNDFEPNFLHRWTFDLENGAVSEEQLDDRSHAFPRVADDMVGLDNRYAYMVQPRGGAADDVTSPGVITKWDNRSGTATTHDLGPTAFPDEPVFVRRRRWLRRTTATCCPTCTTAAATRVTS